MNATLLQTVIDRHADHMAFTTRMDETLGTLHGLSWSDFALLSTLHRAGDSLRTAELADALGIARSRLLLQLLPMEKVGLVARVADEDGRRRIVLRSAGRKQMHEASETAAELSATWLANRSWFSGNRK